MRNAGVSFGLHAGKSDAWFDDFTQWHIFKDSESDMVVAKLRHVMAWLKKNIYIKITLYIQNTYICLSYDDSSFDSLCSFDYIVFPVHKRGKSGWHGGKALQQIFNIVD